MALLRNLLQKLKEYAYERDSFIENALVDTPTSEHLKHRKLLF